MPRGRHRRQSPTGRPREWVGHGRAQVGTWVTRPRLSPQPTPGCPSLAGGGTAKPDAHQRCALQEPCPARAPRASELLGENESPALSPPAGTVPPSACGHAKLIGYSCQGLFVTPKCKVRPRFVQIIIIIIIMNYPPQCKAPAGSDPCLKQAKLVVNLINLGKITSNFINSFSRKDLRISL